MCTQCMVRMCRYGNSSYFGNPAAATASLKAYLEVRSYYYALPDHTLAMILPLVSFDCC